MSTKTIVIKIKWSADNGGHTETRSFTVPIREASSLEREFEEMVDVGEVEEFEVVEG